MKDAAMQDRLDRMPDTIRVPGHEVVGRIVAFGPQVPSTWREGQPASRLGVSGFPVGQALSFLAEKAMLRHERNRGYFVAVANPPSADELGLKDVISTAYFQIANDHLRELLPDQITELDLRDRYDLTKTELAAVLSRISGEGWAERRSAASG